MRSIRVLALAFLAALPTTAFAASLQVSPVSFDLPASTNATQLTLRNLGEESINVQIRVFRWSQEGGEEVLTPTTDVVASPPAATLEPGQDHVVRLVRVSNQPVMGEEGYRILVDELPQRQENLRTAVNFVVRYSMPIFFSEANTKPQLSWQTFLEDDRLVVRAQNAGTRHVRVSQLQLMAASGESVSLAKNLTGYVLPESSMQWSAPLNAIMAFSEVIATEALGRYAQDRHRQYAKDVLCSRQHLLGLVNDLLDLTKIESGKLVLTPKWLDGSSLLHECTLILGDIARKKNITLRATCISSNPKIYADERAIKQIAINLLSNSVKFTPVSGIVGASLDANEEGITLCIRDNGRGIPSDQLARIVQPFEQLDNRYGRANGGTGLGLALVQALTELHGGKFDIQSEVGRGTMVTIWLPRADAADIPLGDSNAQVAA